jgi:hypothetical protein
MNSGLLDPVIVGFVFAPLLGTLSLLFALAWRQMRNAHSGLDMPDRLLVVVVRTMPDARREWGTAMLAELGQIHDVAARWRFALGSARVALFPPYGNGLLQPATASPQPFCGMLAVTLPPLGLPFIYVAAVLIEAIGGSPFTPASRWSHPDLVVAIVKLIILLTWGCLVAGLPLGIAGWCRRERWRGLSVLGMFSSLGIVGYFLLVMSFVAGGGPNGD